MPADGQPELFIEWDANGTPRSVKFADKYFCADNGYAEAVYVCCQGNSLAERLARLPKDSHGTFTIIETGFGTGLDFCCAWQVWDREAPLSWDLHFLSLELYPITPEQLRRALSRWPELSRYKEALAAVYQPQPGGVADLYFDNKRVHLTIVFDHVVTALTRIKEAGWAPRGADAWFLDGFAPAKNPQMWSPEVFQLMAPLSHTGTTCSTFTVAGSVRRGLVAQGFSVKKIPGHGRKRQILTGMFIGPDLQT